MAIKPRKRKSVGWIVFKPGQLVLEGTPFYIQFAPNNQQNAEFVAYRDDVLLEASHTLQRAKQICEIKAQELEEMGIL